MMNQITQFPAISSSPKSGKESFLWKKKQLDFTLKDFWAWNQSNLLENRTRGILAEFIVKKALRVENAIRIEWDAYDILTMNDVAIEVKSASYIQSWAQSKPSSIRFNVAKKVGENGENKRWSDYYIFCLLYENRQERVNPLDLSQWIFYVLRTEILDRKIGNQKTIGLSSLLQLHPVKCDYYQLSSAII